jgi:hypothetical protein
MATAIECRLERYRLSGETPPTGLVPVVIIGAITSVILGFAYRHLVEWIPLIYINFFITLGFGIGLGACVGLGATLGKIRNPSVSLVFGLLFGVIGLYWSWVAYVRIMGEGFVLSPGRIFEAMENFANTHEFQIGRVGGSNTSVGGGMSWYIIWGLEALMVLALSAIASYSAIASSIFCEDCNQWAESKELTFQPIEPGVLVKALENRDYGYLEEMVPTEDKDSTHCKVTLEQCPKCDGLHVLSASNVTVSKDKKGKTKKKDSGFLDKVRVEGTALDILKARAEVGEDEPQKLPMGG